MTPVSKSPSPSFEIALVVQGASMYGWCMARKLSTTVRLDPEDAEALERARKDGHSASDLIRNGLRVVAARYYRGRRPPATRLLFVSDSKLGAESELYKKLKDDR